MNTNTNNNKFKIVYKKSDDYDNSTSSSNQNDFQEKTLLDESINTIDSIENNSIENNDFNNHNNTNNSNDYNNYNESNESNDSNESNNSSEDLGEYLLNKFLEFCLINNFNILSFTEINDEYYKSILKKFILDNKLNQPQIIDLINNLKKDIRRISL
jgi:hypothetical protein